MCRSLTASENIIVKMFSINREWDKTNTVSELLHFLWSNIYICVCVCACPVSELAQCLFDIKFLKLIFTKIVELKIPVALIVTDMEICMFLNSVCLNINI